MEYFLLTPFIVKWVGVILLMCISLSSWSFPRDSTRVVERRLARQEAKIERQRARIMKKWDERTMQQKKTDRRAILFLVISAGILANSIAHKE